MFGVIVTSKLEERLEWLKEVRKTVDVYFPISPEKKLVWKTKKN